MSPFFSSRINRYFDVWQGFIEFAALCSGDAFVYDDACHLGKEIQTGYRLIWVWHSVFK